MKEYFATMETQLKKWDADLEALAAEGQKASDAMRTAYHERIKALRANRDVARQRFQEMRATSGAAAEQLQGGMRSAWETMQKALEKAAAELRK
jgi:predicted  nucleic acid-binding Zn-ribbon protein